MYHDETRRAVMSRAALILLLTALAVHSPLPADPDTVTEPDTGIGDSGSGVDTDVTDTGTTDSEALWQKAVSLYDRTAQWRPHRMRSVTEELSRNGQVITREETLYSLSYTDDDKVMIEILSSEKDGVDLTAERRAEQREQTGGSGTMSLSFFRISPFDPALAGQVRYRATDAWIDIEGTRYQGYSFNFPWNQGNARGTAWLHGSEGIPYRIEFSLDPLPRFVQELSIDIAYTYVSPDEWYPSTITVEGKGGLLFIRKHYRSVISLTEH